MTRIWIKTGVVIFARAASCLSTLLNSHIFYYLMWRFKTLVSNSRYYFICKLMLPTVFKPSDFAIIHSDGHSDFDIEKKIVLRDPNGRKLDLRLNYVRHPDSGGAFKVQIYSPYLVVNKTGLPFQVKSVRSSRAGPPQEVAGDSRIGMIISSCSRF